MEHLSNDHEDHLNQPKNSHKLCNRNFPSRCEFDGSSMETETTTWSEFTNWGKAIVDQILGLEERKKSKRAGQWESQSGIRVGTLAIWVRSFEIIITEFTRSIISTRIGKPVLIMDVKVSKDKNISKWVDREKFIYVRQNRIQNRAKSRRRWLIEETEVRHWVK